MKLIFAALALSMGLSQLAFADHDSSKVYGEGSICDINGCHQTSGEEDFRNEWYLKQYGYSYDSGYRRGGDQGTGVGGTGAGFGYGAGGFGRGYYDGGATRCTAHDRTGTILASVVTNSNQSRAAAKALAKCEARSAHPRSCRVSCN
jgi:hypothetical protein